MFTENNLKDLLQQESQKTPLVSIYVPTFRAGNVKEDRLRFKNALNEAVHCLIDGNLYPDLEMEKKDARNYLQSAIELLEDDNFWLHLSDGLAVFVGEDYFEHFVVPIPFGHKVYLGKHFYTRHLHPLIGQDDRFFLLCLSQGGTRFFEVHKHHIFPVEIKDLVPEDLETAINKQKDTVLQAHSFGYETSIFHGHGGGRETQVSELKDYFRQVDKGLMKMLHDENEPMILAGVDYLIPLYKEVATYPHIMEKYIPGNHEETNPVALHEMAWKIMEPLEIKERNQDREKFEYHKQKGLASDRLKEIVLAAESGKVDTLYVNRDSAPIWGSIVSEDNVYAVKLFDKQSLNNKDLLEMASVAAWKNGGKVIEVPREEMPESEMPMNAFFRY